MPSLLDVLLLILTIQHAGATPMKRYLNSTSSRPALSSTTPLNLARLHPIAPAHDALHSSTNTAAPKDTVSSSDACESMSASTTKAPDTARKGIEAYTSQTGQVNAGASTSLAASSSSAATMSLLSNASTPLHTKPDNRQHDADGSRTTGTTTLTLFTTIPPGKHTDTALPSVTISDGPKPYGQSSQRGSGSAPVSSAVASSTASVYASRSAGLSSSSTIGHNSNTGSTKSPPSTSSPAVWGSLTLTYRISSHSAASSPGSSSPGSNSVAISSTAETHRTRTRNRKHTQSATTDAPSSSSVWAYPTPKISSSAIAESSQLPVSSQPPLEPSQTHNAPQQSTTGGSISAQPPQYSYSPPNQQTTDNTPQPSQTNQASTAETSSPVSSSPPTYPQPPPEQPSKGIPSAISQKNSALPVPPASPTTTTAPAGITIVPINPDATTVYITVTTTEPGWTTTVAEATVTAGWR